MSNETSLFLVPHLNIYEDSKHVHCFRVSANGINYTQKMLGLGGYTKWVPPKTKCLYLHPKTFEYFSFKEGQVYQMHKDVWYQVGRLPVIPEGRLVELPEDYSIWPLEENLLPLIEDNLEPPV